MTASRPQTPPPSAPRRGRAARRPAGFTLVETMVAMAIGIVILLAVSVMYARHSSNFSEIEKTGDLLENGRYALDVLTEDLQTAGYYGELNMLSLSPTYQAADPCSTATTGTSPLGWNTTTASVVVPPAVLGSTGSALLPCLANRASGTPALTVRHAAPDATTTRAGIVAGNLYLQVSRCPNDTLQVIANSDASAFTLKNIACTGVIDELRRFQVRTYFLASCSNCSPSDGLSTLKRAELVDGAIRITPIAEGVERIAFEYGIDGDEDGKPDEFIDASLVTDTGTRLWRHVVSVRATLLLRARSTTQGYTDPRTYTIAGATYAPADAYKRTLLTSTVRLVNVGGRLEQ